MSSPAMSARTLARRLIDGADHASDSRGRVGSNGGVLAAHRALATAYGNLTRSLGTSGPSALLSRALSHGHEAHPMLGDLGPDFLSKPEFELLPSLIERYGAPSVTAAFETVLETLLAFLGRLVGADMVERLVTTSSRTDRNDDEDVR